MIFFGRRLSSMSLLAAGIVAVAGYLGTIAIHTASSRLAHLDDILAETVPYEDPSKAPELQGRIVVAVGTATPGEELRDEAFNIKLPALKFMRESQIYQWNQSGAKVKTYSKDWHPDAVDSYFFDGMHKNTGRVSYPSQIRSAEDVDVMRSGQSIARLDPSFAQFLGGQMKMMLSWEQYKAMPADIRLRFDLVDGSLVEKSAAAGDPQIGDNRTRFMIVPPYEVTVVGMLANGRIMSVDRNSRVIGILKPGHLTVEEIRDTIGDDIIGDAVFPGLLALGLWSIGMLMFRTDFRNAPRVERPIEPIRLGR